MAEQKPNYALERARVEFEIEGLNYNIKRFMLRLLEMEDEKLRVGINVEATKSAIKSLEEKLAALPLE